MGSACHHLSKRLRAPKILNSDIQIDVLITDAGLPDGMNDRQVADAAGACART